MASFAMAPDDMAPVAMAAANSLPKYTYYYQKKEAVENGILINTFGNFLLQVNKNTDRTNTIIEARTSLSKNDANDANIRDDFNNIIKQAYGADTNIDNIVTTTDRNDPEFKEFLNTLNPIIILPVTKNVVRHFRRALVEIEPTDIEISQDISFLQLAPNQ